MVRGDEEDARINEEERREKSDFLHRREEQGAAKWGAARALERPDESQAPCWRKLRAGVSLYGEHI